MRRGEFTYCTLVGVRYRPLAGALLLVAVICGCRGATGRFRHDRLIAVRTGVALVVALEGPGVRLALSIGGSVEPTLFVYEHTPGGIGLSERIFEQKESLVMRVLKLVEGCPCERGCPACVGPSDAILAVTEGSIHTRKTVALELLRSALPTA